MNNTRHTSSRFNAARRGVATVSLVVMLGAGQTFAQWSVAYPNRSNQERSSYGVSAFGNEQAGSTLDGRGAALWFGSAGSRVDLNPAGAIDSSVISNTGSVGGQQGGWALFGESQHAGYWEGSAASWVDLHPAGARHSRVNAVLAGQQFGSVTSPFGWLPRAAAWSGTAASRVDLSPQESPYSEIYGAAWSAQHGTQQVGYAFIGGTVQAGLWGGTAESFVRLQTDDARASVAYAISGGMQGGYQEIGQMKHATIWSGSRESRIDLHPAGATFSVVRAMTDVAGGFQGGSAAFGGYAHATLWFGDAESTFDLHQFLSPSFVSSVVSGISYDATTIYIVGTGYNIVDGRDEALLWTTPIPGPSASVSLCIGAWALSRRQRVRPQVS